jgi:hypothetical protein
MRLQISTVLVRLVIEIRGEMRCRQVQYEEHEGYRNGKLAECVGDLLGLEHNVILKPFIVDPGGQHVPVVGRAAALHHSLQTGRIRVGPALVRVIPLCNRLG